MKLGRSVFLAAALTAMLFAAARAGEAGGSDPAAMLQKGIYQEETAGNVDAAIGIYKEIVDKDRENRRYVAEAEYRLGMCYLKKKQAKEALAAFDDVVNRFGDQKEIASKARQEMLKARGGLGASEAEAAVAKAVAVVSTCAEGDPRIKPAMDSLKGFDEATVVAALAKQLNSNNANERRAAIYILWMAKFGAIDGAVAKLTELMSHEEDTTRGMAALALGGNKVASAYDAMTKMTLDDPSAYARRCAAISLGLLGDARAKDTLNKAASDKDALVRANAQSALKLLESARTEPGKPASSAAPKVVSTVPAAFANDVSPDTTEITVTFDQPMMDKSWSWVSGDFSPKTLGEPRYDKTLTRCTLPVKLEPGKVYYIGVNGPTFTYFQTAEEVSAKPYAIVFATKGADGKATPIPDELAAEARRVNSGTGAQSGKAPKIVSTSPKPFATDVSPDLDKITVTFDQPMTGLSWSWTGGGDTYPKITGKISYDAARVTCTLPVKLEPGKVYWVGVNSKSHRNFKSESGVPAPWFVILFATKGTDGKPTPLPAAVEEQAKHINGV